MLITHGRIVTFGQDPQVIEDGAIYIVGDRIGAIGPTAELSARYPDEEPIDARGQLVLPGSICAHTHFYGAFARGMAIPGEPARNFVEILQKLWWRLDRALDEESIRLSAPGLPGRRDPARHDDPDRSSCQPEFHRWLARYHRRRDRAAGRRARVRVLRGHRSQRPQRRESRHRRERALCQATGGATQSRCWRRPLACTLHSPSGRKRSIDGGRSTVVGRRLSRARRRRRRRRTRQRDEVRPARRRTSQRKRRAGREDAIGALRPRQPDRDRSAVEDQHQGQPSTAQ